MTELMSAHRRTALYRDSDVYVRIPIVCWQTHTRAGKQEETMRKPLRRAAIVAVAAFMPLAFTTTVTPAVSLAGSWARERHIQRLPLGYGRQNVASFKGESSHQEHPFMALVTPGTTQDHGEVYAMNFVYSGNFIG